MPLEYREQRGDLFSVSSSTSLAHCVSVDLVMSKGIATEFRDRFGRVNELKSQSTRSLRTSVTDLTSSMCDPS